MLLVEQSVVPMGHRRREPVGDVSDFLRVLGAGWSSREETTRTGGSRAYQMSRWKSRLTEGKVD